ncbi:unnamed protein product [Protopolystoma xenopodis]|uniref:Uncharacterized protein n=1 Tax=Protopolystoma xenopodis TaxID=117903 RepID=A0A3S4ZMP5_9PLAT|nr:unnamed protein product [Protopolystoma xenopodis]
MSKYVLLPKTTTLLRGREFHLISSIDIVQPSRQPILGLVSARGLHSRRMATRLRCTLVGVGAGNGDQVKPTDPSGKCKNSAISTRPSTAKSSTVVSFSRLPSSRISTTVECADSDFIPISDVGMAAIAVGPQSPAFSHSSSALAVAAPTCSPSPTDSPAAWACQLSSRPVGPSCSSSAHLLVTSSPTWSVSTPAPPAPVVTSPSSCTLRSAGPASLPTSPQRPEITKLDCRPHTRLFIQSGTTTHM